MAAKRELRKLLLEAVDLGKKAEKVLTPDAFQAFVEKCQTNKSIPKLLRDLHDLADYTENVIELLEKIRDRDPKDTKEPKDKEPKEAKEHKEPKEETKPPTFPEFNSMDFLASFAGRAIAAAFLQNQPHQNQHNHNHNHKGGKKKKAIPAALRKQVWNTYIGGPIGETKCPVCRMNTIDKLGFEAGHVIPECAGGTTTLQNLRAICGDCNRSMGTLNMQEYALRYYGHTV